jgi:Ca2+-binding RTX toxin-like protein
LLASAVLAFGAVPARAASTVSASGSTLTVTGSSAGETPRFDVYGAAAGEPGYVRVFDGAGVADPVAPCYRPNPDPEGQDASDVALCESGGTATVLSSLVLTQGAGNDDSTFNVCFGTVTIDMGEGTNTARAPNCPDFHGTFTVTGGSGQDSVTSDDGSLLDIVANLGAGDDTFAGGDGNDIAHGGEGHDYLIRSNGNDQHFGDGGNDDIMGGPGNDVEDGGPGDDRIGYSAGINNDDDQGGDTLRGGDGSDTLLLNAHTGGMTITIDGQANDGAPGEGDNVGGDFETTEGTSANDVFTGSAAHDQFNGGSGNDEIHGGGGDDDLIGGSGDDKVYGDAGVDKVQGYSGADKVDGGAGTDQIYGDVANCSVFCTYDSDELFAVDGEKDSVDCGSGADTAHVDGLDVVAFCTSVDRQGPAPGSTPPPAGTTPAATNAAAAAALDLKVGSSIRYKALSKGGLKLQLSCAGACTITAELRYKTKKLGTGRKTLLKAGRASLAVKPGTAAKRSLRRLKRGKLSLRVKVTEASGNVITVNRTVSYKR